MNNQRYIVLKKELLEFQQQTKTYMEKLNYLFEKISSERQETHGSIKNRLDKLLEGLDIEISETENLDTDIQEVIDSLKNSGDENAS